MRNIVQMAFSATPQGLSTDDGRPAVLVIGGFLGSGKTSLVNHLLRQPAMANTAVIVNEFGELGIDDDLIRHRGDTIIELAGGCICCAMQGTLTETLVSLAATGARDGRPAPDRVLVETTGLANAGPIAHTLMADEGLVAAYRFDRVLTTVDAVNGPGTLDRHPEAVEQVAVADLVVVTKRDLLADATSMDSLVARLRRINPITPIVESPHGRVDAARCLDPLPVEPLRAYGTSTHPADPDPDLPGRHRHDEHITTVTLRRTQPLSEDGLRRAWRRIGERAGPNLLRVKGLVALEGTPGPALVQGAQDTMHRIELLSEWPSADRSTRVVFIGWDLDGEMLEDLWP